jgi:cytochrome c553
MHRHWLIVSVLIGSAAVAAAQAEGVDPQAARAAAKLAVGVCGTCHGPQGNSQVPKYPRLAGQNATYLAAQLRAFRAQTRGDADAMGFMWGMAAGLDDPTIDALAAYYAAQKPIAGAAGDPAVSARGAEIFEHGVEAAGVPACSACHGATGEGLGEFPRLAGQHAQYLLKQLAAFQSNMRNVAVMHGVASGLKVQEMEAVAAFLQGRP